MRRPTRHAVLAIAFVLVAAFAGGASAATRSSVGTESFCSVSKSVVKQLVATADSLKDTATVAQRQAELKTQFTTIKNAEGPLRSSVPHKLKSKLGTVLRLVDLVNTKLSAVSWNFAALAQQPATVAAIEAAGGRADVAIPALKTYYRKTCKFKV